MSNILIVESDNDKYFIEALISHLHPNLSGLQVEDPICQIDDYQCLAGLSKKKLTDTLITLVEELRQAGKGNIEKIGILLDQDDKTEADRLNLVNEAIAEAFKTSVSMSKVSQLVTVPVDEFFSVGVACYFTNVNGRGELETVLKAIKSQESIYADCLAEWRKCLQTKEKELADKDFDKFWVSVYQRFDGCSKKEKQQAERKCSMEASLKHKLLYNFDSPVLDGLKNFLNLFGGILINLVK